MNNYHFVLTCSFVLAFVCGCGGTDNRAPVAKLAGTVTIRGKPLPADAEASVVFRPTTAGEAPPAQAKLINGRYTAEKVPKGQVTAMFRIARLTGKMLKTSPDDVHPTPERIDLVPETSRDGVKIEVTGDNQNQDFDLK